MDVTIPDTITTWVMQAVAINNKTGLGLATPLRIVGFSKYFISLKLPYSVKRGEQVSLLATVFNYHEDEMRVSVKKDLLFRIKYICLDFLKGTSRNFPQHCHLRLCLLDYFSLL